MGIREPRERTGCRLGVVDTATVTSREGPSITFEQTGCVYGSGESDVNEWIVRAEREELRLRNHRAGYHHHFPLHSYLQWE